MHRPLRFGGTRILTALVLGATALAIASFTGLALASGPTLKTAKVKVKGTSEKIVVGPKGGAVYTLSGERAGHLKCTSSLCLMFWPPVKVSARAKLTKGSGVKGTLSKLHRGHFYQVMLNGHPLYYFLLDTKGVGKGDGIKSFGGVWHVIKDTSAGSPAPSPPSPAPNPYPANPYPTYPPA